MRIGHEVGNPTKEEKSRLLDDKANLAEKKLRKCEASARNARNGLMICNYEKNRHTLRTHATEPKKQNRFTKTTIITIIIIQHI